MKFSKIKVGCDLVAVAVVGREYRPAGSHRVEISAVAPKLFVLFEVECHIDLRREEHVATLTLHADLRELLIGISALVPPPLCQELS